MKFVDGDRTTQEQLSTNPLGEPLNTLKRGKKHCRYAANFCSFGVKLTTVYCKLASAAAFLDKRGEMVIQSATAVMLNSHGISYRAH